MSARTARTVRTVRIKDALALPLPPGDGGEGADAAVQGWVRSVRRARSFCFLVLNDGSCQASLQVVVDGGLPNYGEVEALRPGAACRAAGRMTPSRGAGQALEMQASRVDVVGASGEDYPIQKKALPLEFLRERAHLRARTQVFGAVFRVRHHVALATHRFFHDRGFLHVATPVLTAVDAEGAGNQFTATALGLDGPDGPPRAPGGGADFARDYFARRASLCVTGQLEAECLAAGLGGVYSFGPTFRAENSNTPRHLAEFWMVEPEASFLDLAGAARLAVDYVRHLVAHCLGHCADELGFLAAREDAPKGHLEALRSTAEGGFSTVGYSEALDILRSAGKRLGRVPSWGEDLGTEHERFLTDRHFKGPVVVVDWPKDLKAFYMRQNDDGRTVGAMDVLVPGAGEIIGGSQREERHRRLAARMDELGMDKGPLWWYLDLRRHGSVPHSGFGLGVERAVQYITGMRNIRDAIPFPRTPGSCDF